MSIAVSTCPAAVSADRDFSGARRSFAYLVCAATLGLIFAGALVKSHEAGLSVPDWPTSYGYNMFLFPPSMWVDIIFFEHVHRLIASGVGALTVILAGWLLWSEPRRWVKWTGVAAVGLVIVQGILGGLTVLLGLPPAVSVLHGVIGQTFFLLTVLLAYSQSQECVGAGKLAGLAKRSALFKMGLAAVAAIYLQLIAGAVMRHTGSGVAMLDFPTMAGFWIPRFDQSALDAANALRAPLRLPPVESYQLVLHLAHRFGGVLVAIVVAAWALKIRKATGEASGFKTHANSLFLLVFLQFALGALSVLTVRHPELTSVHVAMGALLLGLSFLMVLRIAVRRDAEWS